MDATTRYARGRSALVRMLARRRLVALAVSPMLALLGLLVVPTVPVEAAFGCHYSTQVNNNPIVHDPGGTFQLFGQVFAGYYSGSTVVPLTTGVSAAGIEAQCLLARAGYNPGTIDGVFGPNSQAAARALQNTVNTTGARIAVDGMVGPQTWPWLRDCAQGVCFFQRE